MRSTLLDCLRTSLARPRVPAQPTPRLCCERLEDRCTPTATLVADIVPGIPSSAPRGLTAVNGSLYFSADTPTGELGVYRSNGTAAGTKLLKTVGPAGGLAFGFTPVGKDVYFSATGSLWKTAC